MTASWRRSSLPDFTSWRWVEPWESRILGWVAEGVMVDYVQKAEGEKRAVRKSEGQGEKQVR